MKKLSMYFLPILITILTQCSMLLDTSNLEIIPENNRTKFWQQNKNRLLNLKNNHGWTLLARIGIVSKDGSASCQLDWTNKPFNILLNNAITFGQISISKTSNKITLDYQDKKYISDTPNQLLYQLTNLRLPISELEYWILGLPSQNYPINKIKLNQFALLESLEQSDFIISYDNYSVINDYPLASKITIKSKPSAQAKIFIKIQIENLTIF